MATPLVDASKHDGVMVLALSNPPANTYSYEMMRELDAQVLEARFDPSVHVLLITGAGEKFFCAGADIKNARGRRPLLQVRRGAVTIIAPRQLTSSPLNQRLVEAFREAKVPSSSTGLPSMFMYRSAYRVTSTS